MKKQNYKKPNLKALLVEGQLMGGAGSDPQLPVNKDKNSDPNSGDGDKAKQWSWEPDNE